MARVAGVLKVREGEGRTVALTVGTMAVAAAGLAIGQSGIDGLFFSRFGVRNLPVLYLIQGPLLFVASLGATAALVRVDRRRAFTAAPLALAALLILERLAAATGSSLVFPVLWLSVSVAILVQSLFTWGLAGLVTDTRQAKRLFPLFGAGSIAGAVLGGIVTKPLADALGAPNLLLVWAALLVGAFALGSAAVPTAHRALGPRHRQPARRPTSRPLDEIRKGLAHARRSSLVAALAAAAVCFSVLYYSVYLPFSAASVARYPSADALAGFFGLFSAVTTGAALVVSVVIANRLLSRIGVAAVVAILAVVYVVGFGVLIATEAFAAIVAFRFVQMVLAQGLVSPAWEALVNVVPPSRRDQTRAFLNGGPTQVGTMIAGVLQLAGEHALSRSAVAAIGLAVAVVTVILSIRIRRAYTSAVVDALREGRPQVFGVEGEEPFGGLVRDPTALRATLEAAADPDPRVRRVAVHALAEIGSPEAREALVRATSDPDPETRARALRGLAGDQGSMELARRSLSDPDAGVRIEAATAVLAAGPDPEADRTMRDLLEDPDPAVRAEAVESLVASGGADPSLLEDRLDDPASMVRAAAVRAVAVSNPERLVALLGDHELVVRAAAAESLASTATPEMLVASLSDPALAPGALIALERLRAPTASAAVRAYALAEAAAAEADRAAASGAVTDGDEARALLRDSLVERGRRRAVNAIRAAAILSTPANARAVGTALEDLGSRDGAQVANALEAIESATDQAIVRPVLRLWEPLGHTTGRNDVVERALGDQDPWIRACAELVRSREGRGDPVMDEAEVTTLSVMERVLFLRKVSLFADLSPPDLKRVADVAEERAFGDDDTIAVEGETGDEMHVVVSGTVRVLRSTADGGELEIARRTSGDAIGEMAVVTNEPRIASLVAAGDVRTLRIGRKEFESILRERPDTALGVIRVLSHRLAERSSAEQVV
jgi:HEAT repeat protein